MKFIDRIEKTRDRFVLLPLLDEINQAIRADELLISEYRTVVNSLLNHISIALFGQLTPNEFDTRVTALFLHETFADETLPLLIYKMSEIDVRSTYQFSKVVELIHSVREPLLLSIFRRRNTTNDCQQKMKDTAFCQALWSFKSRIFNYFGLTSSDNYSFCKSSCQEHENGIIRAIVTFLDEHNAVDGNLGLCAKLIAQDVVGATSAAVLDWLSNRRNSAVLPASILLHPDVDARKQESTIIAIFSTIRDGNQLATIFGDAVRHDAVLKRLLTQKLLTERIVLSACISSSSSGARASRIIAQYLHAVGDSVLSTDVFRRLVSVFADQSQLLDVVGYDHQVQIAVAILDLVKIMPKSEVPSLREEVVMKFTESVPFYLKLPDNARRHVGLFVTEFVLGRLTSGDESENNQLHFDYNNEDATLTELRRVAADDILSTTEVPPAVEAQANGAATKRKQPAQPTRRVGDPRTAVLDSDDDDAEEEKKDIEQRSTPDDDARTEKELLEYESQERNRPHYLRDCLELLASEKTSFRDFAVALRALSGLIRQRSVGFDDVAAEVFDRMCCLEDRFRMPRFQELRRAVAAQTLAYRPDLVGHAVRVLFSRQCSMATRFFILSCMDDAAAGLAGERLFGDTDAGTTNDQPSKVAVVFHPTSCNQQRQLGRVIRQNVVKQPAVRSRKNDFADVLPQFAFPLLNVGNVGSYLDLYDRDSILMGKILSSVGQMIVYARFSPSLPAVVSTTLTLLRALRNHSQTFIVSGCLFCYAAIADTPSASECYGVELADALEWMEPRAGALDTADPMYRETLAIVFVKLRDVLYGDAIE